MICYYSYYYDVFIACILLSYDKVFFMVYVEMFMNSRVILK